MAAIETPTPAFNGQQLVTTSYYGVGGDASLVQEIMVSWDAVVAATLTVWTTNFPEVLLASTDPREWVQQNPPTGYTAISPGGATAATPLVLVIAGTTAGSASMQIGNTGTKRMRVRVVCTVAGQLRIQANGKE